jgi:hypothetical protein
MERQEALGQADACKSFEIERPAASRDGILGPGGLRSCGDTASFRNGYVAVECPDEQASVDYGIDLSSLRT